MARASCADSLFAERQSAAGSELPLFEFPCQRATRSLECLALLFGIMALLSLASKPTILEVGGAGEITTGAGNDHVAMPNSIFHKTFQLGAEAGHDWLVFVDRELKGGGIIGDRPWIFRQARATWL